MPSSTTTVNLYSGGVYPTVHAVQNDTGRVLKMVVMDETIASGSTGKLYFVRPDKSMYNVSCTLVLADNAFTANIAQALTKWGKCFAQLKITSSGLVVSTHTFVIDVERSTDGAPTEQAGVTIEEFIEMVQSVEDSVDDIADLVSHLTLEDELNPDSDGVLENRVITKSLLSVSSDSENLISYATFEPGHITSSGVDDDLEGCFRSSYIPVTAGDRLRIDPNGKYLTVVEYDASRSFVKLNGYYASNNTTLMLRGTTRFIRFVIRSNPINPSDTSSIVDSCCVKRLESSRNNDISLANNSINLINATHFESGSINGTTGLDYSYAGYFRSSFISVQPGDRLRIDPNGKYLTVAEYTVDGVYIKMNGFYSSDNTTLTLSGATGLIRFVIRSNPTNTSDTDSIVYSCVVERLGFENNNLILMSNNGMNIIEYTRFEPGSLGGTSGRPYNNPGCFRSAFVPVVPYDILAINPNGKYLTVVEFDRNGGFIQLDGYYGSNKTTLTLGSTTHYIKFVIRSNPQDSSDTVSIVNTCEVKKFNFSKDQNIGLQMFSRIGVIGDSVSVGWTKDAQGNRYRRNLRISWPQQMCRRLGSIGYNLGASGVDPIEWFDSSFEYYEYCYPNYVATEECELYIIGLGLNGGTIGSTADINQNDYTQNGGTFYGQYARMIQMINHDHPKSKVICLTEPSTKATSYDQAIRDICELSYIDAELVDLDNDYYWYFNNSVVMAESQGDNLHYTPHGYSLIADAMITVLNDYIFKHPANFKYVGAGVTETPEMEPISSQEIEDILSSIE